MMYKFFLVLGLLLATTIATHAQNKRFKQGVCGRVTWKAGNRMPSPERKETISKATPVVREVYIYELTNNTQVVRAEEDGFYHHIKSKLVKKVVSDKKGRFSFRLPSGYYSIFVKEEKGLYANIFDDAMNIHPVYVEKGKWSKIDLEINYQAVY